MKNIYKVNEEAVKKIAEKVYDNGSTVINRNDLEEMFPELKKGSDDERIREELKEVLDICLNARPQIIKEPQYLKFINWLEEKGEQKLTPIFRIGDTIIAKDGTYIEKEPFHINRIEDDCYWDGENTILVCNQDEFELFKNKPADKVETKFKVGDLVVNQNGLIRQIIGLRDGVYFCLREECCDDESNPWHGIMEHVDTYWHKWTIQDAKAGDVLAAHECLVLFKKIDGLNIRCYCTYHYLNHQAFYVDTLQNKTAFHPATKEQRELLFQKMKEAEYEWNNDKKELKKIEQKPAEWTHKDGKNLAELWEILSVHRNTNLQVDNLMEWVKDLVSYKRQEWSEEDEKMINSIAVHLNATTCGFPEDRAWADRFMNWLNSIKDRVQPQPKQEWSEEDENGFPVEKT